MMVSLSCSLFVTAATAHAYTTFETTCTTPNVTTNFVSSPNTRGTLDILWSCLFTMLACTWTVQHLNIPEQRGNKDEGWWGDVKWKLKGFWSSLKWMLATAIAPELLLAKNMGDLAAARSNLPRLQELAAEDQVPWTLTHTLFANVGGFMIRSRQRSQQSAKTQGYSTFAYLNSFHVIKLRETGHLRSLPNVSLADIDDKSKSDMFARLVAIIQITWTVLQTIVRAAKGLAISQLEIAVIAFSSCAIFIYILNWKKPKGVKTPYFVLTYEEGIPPDVREILEQTSEDLETANIISRFSWGHATIVPFDSPIPNDSSVGCPDTAEQARVLWLGLALGTIVFGAIHVAAWNFDFPTNVEQLVWRVTSIWCTIAIIIVFRFAFRGSGDNLKLFVPFSSVLYILARLFLLVETFRSLCFLPPDAYISTWATNFPHLA